MTNVAGHLREQNGMQSSISSQKTPKYKKWAKKKNSLKSFDPKLFYDEVPMVGLEPTWFPERF